MKRLLVQLLALTFIVSCGGKVEKNDAAATTPNTTAAPDTSDYLPVAYLLNEDMRNVETYAGGILKKTASGEAKDSMYIQYRDFQLLAGQFFLKELDSAFFKNNYSETSLMDETSGMLNFIYTAKDSTSPLRRLIAYIKPSLSNDKIDRIYMETEAVKDNVRIEKRLTWQMGKYFYVITRRQPPSGDPTTTMEKLIWDPQHFGDK